MSKVVLSKEVPIPLYHQLKTILLERVKSGELKSNDKLPSEDEIAEQYGISKATVRQAIGELASEGVIRREQGRGTYVAEQKIEQGPRALTGFTEEMAKHGLRSSSRVLKQRVIKADVDAAQKLQVAEGDALFELTRLRLADGEPMGLQTALIPLALAPGIKDEDFSASLYDLLETRYSLVPNTAEETHTAILLGAREAKLLRVPLGSPALAAERVTYLANKRPFEMVHSVMRGDRYKIILQLSKNNLRG
ncbi:MAG TPA: GntR family transcriptional regulator [Pyrinomonadaceae bacterium]|nr:GntR family transcriptional regulator [Pyrinomonadaceae bacterium]